MAPRSFAALIDQDSVMLLEYHDERGGFRLLDTRMRSQRFLTVEDAVDAIAEMLGDMNARRARLSVVLQHFGAFFHALPLPPAGPEHLGPIIQREVQRSFNVADPAIAYATGKAVERPDAPRAAVPPMHQVFIAGAPRQIVEAIQARFAKAKIKAESLTVAPEVFRRLYETLDGAHETTALLACLANGPHLAYFVNAQLELAIEPPLRLEGEPLDSAGFIDQLERGAIYLRQHAHGAVATRLLLVAPGDEYEALASTIEARTGMDVVPLGQNIGSPEAVVAMGAVLSARADDRLDLFPRPPSMDERLKSAMSGPNLVRTSLFTAAAVSVFWAGMQLLAVKREQRSLEEAQLRVEHALPAIARARESAEGRERIASIRAALGDAIAEKSAVSTVMAAVPAMPQSSAQLDSLHVDRTVEGIRATLFGHARAPTGPAATSAANFYYRRFKSATGLKDVSFESSFRPRDAASAIGEELEHLSFTISGLSPVGGK
jgi:hypothetical protein